MRTPIKITLVVLALGGGSFAAGAPAMAEVAVNVVPGGGIAFGYNDGYWDRGHAWHAWKNQDESNAYRTANHDHYYDYKHDRDNDQGWRDKEQYWGKH